MTPAADGARPTGPTGQPSQTGVEEYTRAMLNILEDFAGEKTRLEETQRAILNILDDFTGEKERLEENQRAMLNLLEDFDVERAKTESANRELREAFDSLRRAKEAADAANRELEAFSYSVSHDLRAPLRAIDGFSQALLDDYQNLLDDTGGDYLRRVRGATQRMAQLIDDLLKLSRLTRGELNLGEVNLSLLAGGVVAELQKSQPDRRVTFRIAEGLIARCDPSMIKVVLENLLGNSWKFTGKKERATIEFGAIEMRNAECGVRNPSNSEFGIRNSEQQSFNSALRTPHSELVFYVRDNGAGFDMAYADKLFATFQRLHLEKEFPGTGIGLSLVQRIIRRHGGNVWAEGEVGRGATFYFTLGAGKQAEG